MSGQTYYGLYKNQVFIKKKNHLVCLEHSKRRKYKKSRKMKISIITTGVAIMLSIMMGQASGNQPNCQTITEGICQNYEKLSYRSKSTCVNDKNTKCLTDGYVSSDDNGDRFWMSADQLLNCFNKVETVTHCLYINGSNQPCVNIDIDHNSLYCIY